MNLQICERDMEFFLESMTEGQIKEISDFLSVSRRMLEKVWKELEDSGFNYEAALERKMCDQWSYAARMLEFIGEVQIFNNEPSNSMHDIAREKGVDEKLIRLVVHENIR